MDKLRDKNFVTEKEETIKQSKISEKFCGL